MSLLSLTLSFFTRLVPRLFARKKKKKKKSSCCSSFKLATFDEDENEKRKVQVERERENANKLLEQLVNEQELMKMSKK